MGKLFTRLAHRLFCRLFDWRCAIRTFQNSIDETHVRLGRLARIANDGIAVAEQQFAKFREMRTAAASAAGLRNDHRFLERRVQLINQRPSLAVRHFHRAPGSGDGAEFIDLGHERQLAGPKPPMGAQINAYNQVGHSARESQRPRQHYSAELARKHTASMLPPVGLGPGLVLTRAMHGVL